MSDTFHMQRALAIAATGLGRTGENPCVGCTIVRDGVIVGEARTADTGRPHAEEQALAQAGDARGATAYVTLEPCAKRTSGGASCSDLLIAAGIARVVIAIRDPHPFAAGIGIERLRAAGVQVDVGLLEEEARAQNADFFAKYEAKDR
jgi:diaminohydroxyphosphoribosylaminopyrimidine deaminase/5-amino-6-(5-phosphoribosylamino)uracil reductase